MFQLVESQFDEEDLETMGAEMEEEKANFNPQSSSAGAR